MNYQYFHGILNSLIQVDNSGNHYDNELATRSMTARRNIVFHRLDLKVNKKITLGASEIIIYGYRKIDLHSKEIHKIHRA